jgi:mannosyltransferase OCH1-like enzyme
VQRSKGLNRIFTFWEPRDHVPAYLRLCRDTWTRNSPGFDITVLDHDNLEHHTGPDALDIETLKSARLGLQKDAILFAVLAKNGGIFMDMDTIVLSSLQDIQRKLDTTELLRTICTWGSWPRDPGPNWSFSASQVFSNDWHYSKRSHSLQTR